jgi:hypothetical protein
MTEATEPRARRGRPKGTGIDDAAMLARIGAMLRADQALKPTTAIKQVGVTDPSIVRRLREKLKHRPTEAAPAPLQPSPPARARRTKPATPIVDLAQRTAPTALRVESAPAPLSDAAKREQQRAAAHMLASYLEAMAATTTQAEKSTPASHRTAANHQRSAGNGPAAAPAEPAASPIPPPHQRESTPPQDQPTTRPEPSAPPRGFMFPGFLPFMQPYLSRPTEASQPAPSATSPDRQVTALKLSIEAMTAMAKLQLYVYENALAHTPFGMMLQGQAYMGQMLMAALTGQANALKKKDT